MDYLKLNLKKKLNLEIFETIILNELLYMDYKWIIWLSLIVLNISRFFFLSERRKFYLNFSYKELWAFVINSEYRINFFSASNRSSNKLSRNLTFIESESCDKKFFLAKHFLVEKKKKTWQVRVHCTNSTRLHIFMHHRKNLNGEPFRHSNITVTHISLLKIFQKFTRYERNYNILTIFL